MQFNEIIQFTYNNSSYWCYNCTKYYFRNSGYRKSTTCHRLKMSTVMLNAKRMFPCLTLTFHGSGLRCSWMIILRWQCHFQCKMNAFFTLHQTINMQENYNKTWQNLLSMQSETLEGFQPLSAVMLLQ